MVAKRILLHRFRNDGKKTAELHVTDDIAFTSAESEKFGSAPPAPRGSTLVYWKSHCWVVKESVAEIKDLIGIKD